MELIKIKDKRIFSLNCYRYLGDTPQWDWIDLMRLIVKKIPFDIASKYSHGWTALYQSQTPFDGFDDEQISNYIEENGNVINHSPLVWKFSDNQHLSNLIEAFLNESEWCLSKLKSRNFHFTKDFDEVISIQEWCQFSSYFLTSLVDNIGIVFVSQSEREIENIYQKMKTLAPKSTTIAFKGDCEIPISY